jgi:hypothetical protein
VGIHYFKGFRRRVGLFHSQTLLGADFYAAAALDALHPFDDPLSLIPINGDTVGRAFSHADSTKDAILFHDADMTPGPLFPNSGNYRIHQGGRFLEQAP